MVIKKGRRNASLDYCNKTLEEFDGFILINNSQDWDSNFFFFHSLTKLLVYFSLSSSA